jgi:peptidoglycan/xylan/chitin deacetylase (PgdA/CDA1 family)
MLDFRLAGLALYYSATRAMRQFFIRRWRLRSCVPMTVLMYHYVGSDCKASWATSPSRFRRHVEWLSEHTDVVPLCEIQRRLAVGNTALRPCVAITFDDGYAANLDETLPLLLDAGMPVTFFVTVTNMLKGQPFAHGLERGQTLRPISQRELRDLADSGVEIGSHGLTHADYSRLSETELIREIAESKIALEDLIGRPVRSLAVPFGQPRQMTDMVFRIAREAGYDCVCSAYGGYNVPGRHHYHIRRFHGDDSLLRLMNRVTVDPRLVWKTLFRDPISSEPVKESSYSPPVQVNHLLTSDDESSADKDKQTHSIGCASVPIVVLPFLNDTTCCLSDRPTLGGRP